MSTEGIKFTLNKAQSNLRLYFLCFALTLVGAGFWFFLSFKEQVASIAVTQSQPSLIKGDYRSAVVEISLSVSPYFTYISFRSNDGNSAVTVPPVFNPPPLHYILEVEVKPPGFLEKLGVIEFGVDLFPFATFAVFAVSLGGLVMFVLSRRMRVSLLSDYRRSLDYERSKVFNELATQVAHDIRSPLSALNTLVSTSADLPAEKKDLLQTISNRIHAIGNDLLSAHKRVVQDESLTQVMIAPLVDQITSEKRLRFQEHEIRVDIPEQYRGARAHLRQEEFLRILSNLIDNSVEADASSITVGLRSYRDRVEVIVNDNGRGIPEEILERLGEPGVTSGKENTTSGSGIGLYMAKRTVEKWGGSLRISSRIGVGTMVTISLPSEGARATL